MIKPWVNTYTGIPFVDHGRDRLGCDCYGLVRMVFFDQRGVDLPLLTAGYEDTKQREDIAEMFQRQPLLIGFEQVLLGQVQPFDVLVIRQMGFDCHLGVVASPGIMLHTESGKGAVIEEYLRPHIKPRVKEAWRYVG